MVVVEKGGGPTKEGHGDSGPTWDGEGRECALVIKRMERMDSLGCRQDSHKISGGSALCLAPLATWGGRLRQLRDGFAFAFTCFQVACLLAWPGKAGQMIHTSRGQPTGDGWPLTCDTADETRH